MPLYFKGRSLHSYQPNQYRLENASGRVLLTHNNIASHPVYQSLLNETKLNNKNEVGTLSQYIANRIRNERNLGNTRRKFNSMVDKILNHRKASSVLYKNKYLSAMENFRARVAPIRVNRAPYFNTVNRLKNIEKTRSLTRTEKAELRNATRMTEQLTRILNAEENAYKRTVKDWVVHRDQLRYWQWVKNRVSPEVRRLLK